MNQNLTDSTSETAVANFYVRTLWWTSPFLFLSGLLYDAYLDPDPLVSAARNVVLVGAIAIALEADSGRAKPENTIRYVHVLCFAFMTMIALGYWEANASPLLLSLSFLSALVLGHALHSEKVIGLLYLWSGSLLGIGLMLSSQPINSKIMMGLSIVIYITLLGIIAITALRNRVQLGQSEQTMDAVFEHSSDALLGYQTQSGDVIRANLQAHKLFETTDNPTIGYLARSSYLDANPEEDQKEVILKALNDDSVEATVQISTARGNSFWGRLSVRRIKVANNDITLLRIADVTAAHLEHEALQAARDAAESAALSRSQFLANMSHEIRTPMNGVIGMASLLADTPLDPQQTTYVDTIRSSGESLLHILNEILDFSKIDADQVVLEERVFELEQCVFDAIGLIAPIAADKELEVLCKMDNASRGYFVGDTQRLRQVIVNLLSNAIKFTERGEILVEVAHAKTKRGASNLSFLVTDTGAGVPAERVPALFDPFTQADSSTTRKYGGTGLGLSICRRLVELMGGEIELKSSSPKGTTFGFNIVVHSAELPKVLPDFEGRNLSVLAVDDNETNRVILQAMLASMKLDATVLDHPHKALAHFEEFGADLIISDMQMPDMDGLQLVLEMQAVQTKQGKSAPGEFPKTMLLSSLDATPQAHNLFDMVLPKPARPSELQAALVSLVLPQESEDTTEKEEETLTPLPVGRLNILLAEDNLVNQKVAMAMLDKLGFSPDLATNGREALDMLRDHHYDIVLMDVQMPVLDGLEATRLIRADQQLSPSEKHPYIVAMTANAMREDRAACVAAGMNDFVAKPIRLADVHACLAIASEVLEIAGSTDEPVTSPAKYRLRD